MSTSPLAGTLVVDLSRHLPGPYAARLLGDLGARVIKIEEPELGDPVRLMPPYRDGAGRPASGALAELLLAGAESVAADLKLEGGRRLVERLAGRADVLLETFRPGTLERLGLAPERLRRLNRGLVVCSLSGFGQDGPWAARAGHDLTYQALAGTLASTGRMPSLPAADLLGAWSVVAAVLAALVERQRTGEGAWIDAALLDAAVHANLTALAAEAGGPRAVGEPLALTGRLACYDLYRARDGGWVALACLEPRFWRAFCRAAGRRDLLPHQYAAGGRGRRKVAALIATRTREEWGRFFAEHDLPGEPLLSVAGSAAHPQVAHRGVVVETPDDGPRLAFPARFDGERPPPAGPVPRLGQHTAAVVAEFDSEAADRPPRALRAAGLGRRPSLRRALYRLLGRRRR